MDQNTPAESSQYKSCQQPPEISIEWRDVEIEVKVLGVDLPPQDFVRLYPTQDEHLLSAEEMDAYKSQAKERRRREKYKGKMLFKQ